MNNLLSEYNIDIKDLVINLAMSKITENELAEMIKNREYKRMA